MGNYISKIWATNTESIKPIDTTTINGWKRDTVDSTDYHHFDESNYTFMSTPIIDLRSAFPPVYDQMPINGTASAIASMYEFNCPCKTNRPFVYYNEKEPGVAIRDAIKMLDKSGIYDTEMKYERLAQDIDQLRQCLCEGIPFVFGFSVYDSFESLTAGSSTSGLFDAALPRAAWVRCPSDSVPNKPDCSLRSRTGIMPMPKDGEKLLGGHAVVAVGFNDLKEHFIVRNSWGNKWGDGGYFYMPYNFMTNPDLCADFWLIRRVCKD